MARTAEITLDGVRYTVHAFNIKELREVGEILGSGSEHHVSAMKLVSIAMRRAEPKIEDVETLEPTLPEMTEAAHRILKLCGITAADPQAAAPATS